MRFWEAVQQLRELPEYGWAIVRGDLVGASCETWDLQTGYEMPWGYSFLDQELRVVQFDEIYSKGWHTGHDTMSKAYGPSFRDLDATDWMLTRAGGKP